MEIRGIGFVGTHTPAHHEMETFLRDVLGLHPITVDGVGATLFAAGNGVIDRVVKDGVPADLPEVALNAGFNTAQELGFDDLPEGAVVMMEWPDRAAGFLPPDRLDIAFTLAPQLGPEYRNVRVTGHGAFAARVDRLAAIRRFLESSGYAEAVRKRISPGARSVVISAWCGRTVISPCWVGSEISRAWPSATVRSGVMMEYLSIGVWCHSEGGWCRPPACRQAGRISRSRDPSVVLGTSSG